MDTQRLFYKFRKTIPGRLIMLPLNMFKRLYVYLRVVMCRKFGWKVPDSYAMKVEWIKLYDRNPMYVQLADKVKVKEYVKELVGEEYLIKTLGVYKSAEDIDFNKLPDRFVLKTNNASGTNIICRDKSKLDISAARTKLQKWVEDRSFGWKAGEWHYRLIEPRILCEEFVNDKNGELRDYKFFCFNGVPRFVWVDIDRYKPDKSRAIFDAEWNRQNMTLATPDYKGDVKKPENYDLMLKIAAKLSQGLKLVRVDLYNVDGKILFGEMTFFSGDMFFRPRKFDKVWGSLIDIEK